MTSPLRWQFHEVAGPFGLTEGPAWDGEALLFSNLPHSRILRYRPETQETETWRQGTRMANGLMLDRRGRLYACEAAGRCIACYHRDGTRTVIAGAFQGRRLNSPNDLALDLKGRIWFSD
ncbi:MAG: SMP-30/gluconolactonase/LRE family protein, partial [Acidobacteria bacterium]|nr:SMP-30/gluconolactonase/LRE family protein [Acidobacteriota bacterium]